VNFPELFRKMIAEVRRAATKAETTALLKTEGDKLASYLDSPSDSFLAEGSRCRRACSRPRRRGLRCCLAKEHEMHHRGQLMVMQRMIGLVPHLTRQMQERMAQHAATAQAR
jgi:uncharacterized damage-inducible protein DinB